MTENALTGTSLVAKVYGLPEDVIEYRLGPDYYRPNLARVIFYGGLSAFLAWTWSRGHIEDLLVLSRIFGAIGAYNGVAYVWRRRFRTRLTAQGVKIYGYFNHFVRWRDVQGFEVSGFGNSQPLGQDYDPQALDARGGARFRLGGRAGNTGRRARLGTVYLIRASGRKMLLRAPIVTSWTADPFLEQKVGKMRELCSQYGTRPVGQ
jgi:hypothetical protein